MSYQKVTGIILIFILITLVGSWVLLLTYINPENVTWQDNLSYILSHKGVIKHEFYFSLISSVISIILIVLCFYKKTYSKKILLFIFLLCTTQAILPILVLGWHLKLLYTSTVIFSYLSYKNPNKLLKPTPKSGAV